MTLKAADDSITVGDDGIKVNTGGITPVTKDDGDKKSGQVALIKVMKIKSPA